LVKAPEFQMARIEICPVCGMSYVQGTRHEHTLDGQPVKTTEETPEQTSEFTGEVSLLDLDKHLK